MQNRNSPIIEFLIIFHDLVIILIIILIINLIFLFLFIFNIAIFSKNFRENQKIEDFFLFIPIIFLIFIGFPSIKNLYICDELNECDLRIKVIGHQWYWSYEILNLNINFNSIINKENYNFRLLETYNHLILPIKSSIRFLISSEDVIHSWTIPSLGIKNDAIPGHINQVSTLINRCGIIVGQCSEICGINHSFIPIIISSNSIINFLYNSKCIYKI